MAGRPDGHMRPPSRPPDEQAIGRQAAQGPAHRGTADPEPLAELELGWQRLAGPQFPVVDLPSQLQLELVGDGHRAGSINLH